MNIDWFVFISQIVNFLILVVLLKHFLYDRIVKMMDQREQKIASRLQEAESKNQQAEQQLQEYQDKQKDLENKKKKILQDAEQDAEQQKKQRVEEARKKVDALRSRWKQSIEREKDDFLQEIERMVGDQVYAISRRALHDLADRDLEQQVVGVFVDRISGLSPEDKKHMTGLMEKSNDKIFINSAFDLSNQDKETIRDVLQKELSRDLELQFGRNDDLICGIELKLDGKRIVWSIDHYIAALREQFNRSIENELQRGKQQAEKPENDHEENHGPEDE